MEKIVRGKWRVTEDGELVPKQTDDGREVLDPTPVALPVQAKVPLPLAEQVARLVNSDAWRRSLREDVETFAEADDFDVDDDFDPSTPYEVEFDPLLGKEISPKDFHDPARREYYRDEYLKAERNAIRAEERQRALDEAYRRYYRQSQSQQREAAEGAAPSPKPGS